MTGGFGDKSKVEAILKQMTLEEKVGQMIMASIYGPDVDDDTCFILNQFHAGGVLVQKQNMYTKDMTERFIKKLQIESKEKVPLFIGVWDNFNWMPKKISQKEIGLTGDPNNAFKYAKDVAEELKAVGVNLIFEPSADVSDRAEGFYSNDAKKVAEFVSQEAKAYESVNFLYCPGRFPGEGQDMIRWHVQADMKTLESKDFIPFKKIIDKHDNSKFMIMTSLHKYDAIDSENYASMSRAIVTDLLRNKLHFDGVIITMPLILRLNGTTEEKTIAATEAGADIILVDGYSESRDAYNAILNAVRDGRISEERINESVRRIIRMKLNLQK